MRIFVAVFPPPEVVKEALAAARLPPDDRIRWTRPENVHLTLKFLGDVREELLDDIRAVLEEVCASHAPFKVALAGLGAFPSARRARILWASVGEGSGRLRSLATGLDTGLTSSGFEHERRPYTPHLTLGRVRGNPASLQLTPGSIDSKFMIGSIELVESMLTPEGSVYKTQGTLALSGKS